MTPARGWSTADIPDQTGRRAIVTGPGGLGYETALGLARSGATVLLAGRDADKGARALAAIRAAVPDAEVSFAELDLANLSSVAAFALDRLAASEPLDILINNAGVMALPRRSLTDDGFERQFGVNVIGHFALTGRLLPLLRKAAAPRVVQLSSLAHRRGRIDFDDLEGERRYDPWKAYCQSKLAMLIFALELQRRSDRNGWGLTSLAAHPGWAASGLIGNGPATGRTGLAALVWRLVPLGARLLSQSTAAGALPTLYAATAPNVAGGGYYGPDGWREIRGSPAPARATGEADDPAVAARLWDVLEAATGAPFAVYQSTMRG
ncbi:MAG: SDR family oxidoreductase [Beijerinckiaceae bacterium]|nr:SDR family oxidoreductase [Beijerinckiaceae bacterium]